jgi:hypothetical protein
MIHYAYQVFHAESNSFVTILLESKDPNQPGKFLGEFNNLSQQQIQFPEFTLENGRPEIKVKQSSYQEYLQTQLIAAEQNLSLQKQNLLEWNKIRRMQLLAVGKKNGVTWNGIQFDADHSALQNVTNKLASFLPGLLLGEPLPTFTEPLRWTVKNNHYHLFQTAEDFLNFANEFVAQVQPVINDIFQSSFNHRDYINFISTIEELNAYRDRIKADYFDSETIGD